MWIFNSILYIVAYRCYSVILCYSIDVVVIVCSSNSIYLYTKINIIFYNVFYCLSNSLQVWVMI